MRPYLCCRRKYISIYSRSLVCQVLQIREESMMGGSKANVAEANNNTEFSKLDALKTRSAMVNSSRQPRRIPIRNLVELSSDSDFAETDGCIPVEKVNQRKEPDNWSLYELLETPAGHQLEVQNRRYDQYNTGMSLWSRSPMSAHSESIMSEDDDDYLFRPMSSVSSARSSISWAEDAVEAEFTDQLASLWEDVERVCGGEEKPAEMSTIVYDECLQWRRAFPQQTLILPSRFASLKIDEDSTPTPTNNDTFNFEDIEEPAPLSAEAHGFRPITEESVEDCLTPTNPTKSDSSEYVTSWLTDCHQTKFPFYQNGGDYGSLPPVPRPLAPTPYSTSALTSSPTNYNAFRPIARKPNHVIHEEIDSSEEEDESGRESQSLTWAQTTTPIVKVQRPVSSYAKGHMMTPMRTTDLPDSTVPQTCYSKPANYSVDKSTPNSGHPSNRITSSLPAGRTAPNFISSPPFNLDRIHETMSSGYRHRKPLNYSEQQQKSRATLATINLNSTHANNFTLPSASPYWSRHTNSNSPTAVPEETNAQVETFFNGDFSQSEETAEQRKRPTNLTIPVNNMAAGGECGDVGSEKPVKPFLFWLFDRVSPN